MIAYSQKIYIFDKKTVVKYLVIIYLIVINCIISGQSDFPPCAAFETSGKDTIKTINSHSNSLYAGIDNYIEIDRKKIPHKNIILECERGMAMEDEGSYIVIPARPGYTMINIYEYDHGDTNLIFKKTMKVNSVPQPYITMDNIKLSNYKYFPREEFSKTNHFMVHLSEDFINDSTWYQIKEIVMGFPVGQQYITLSSEGNSLSDEMLASIQKLMAGKELAFTFTLVGSGGLFKRIPPIRVKIY
jgi:hypothetical protein